MNLKYLKGKLHFFLEEINVTITDFRAGLVHIMEKIRLKRVAILNRW